MREHDRLRVRLEARRGEIIGRLGRIERDLRRPADPDWTEQATLQENDEVLAGLDDLERAELATIRETLRRIEHGEYGTCARCGSAIEQKRLDAMPTADTCIRCAAHGA